MYSGTTLTPLKWLDACVGAHQKIDRIARHHLANIFEGRGYYFPTGWQILKFEGQNGPDGIKRKAPAQDEPWHFYDPTNPEGDTRVIDSIVEHYELLVVALRERNQARASFEAAWLAHAIVDGLTPAHHYPYEAELTRLRGGNSIDTRTSVKEKLLMHGDTVTERVGNNWKMWGDKGLLATHFAFEWGVAVIILPLRMRRAKPTDSDLFEFRHLGMATAFHARAKAVADLGMYEAFYKSSWTPKLAKQVRRQLVPIIINTVTAAWYSAVLDSQQPAKRSRQTRQK
jgi:hypothetical protein